MPASSYDEMRLSDREPRAHGRDFWQRLGSQPPQGLAQKRAEAALFHRAGIPFALHGQTEGAGRLIPFDSVPRIIPAAQRARLEAGLPQRVRALNAFVSDIYHERNILRAGVIGRPRALCNLQSHPEFRAYRSRGNLCAPRRDRLGPRWR